MWQRRSAYKSFNDYQYDRVLQQKRNIAQVESVLTLYQHNNKNLVGQVQQLIRENRILKKQNQSLYLSKSRNKQSYFQEGTSKKYSENHQEKNFKQKNEKKTTLKKKIVEQARQNLKQKRKQNFQRQEQFNNDEQNQIIQNNSQLKNKNGKQNVSKYHPRNAYLAPQQIQRLNLKQLNSAKIAHKTYNHSRQYENFKQKLSEKKEELKNSYKSNIKTNSLIEGNSKSKVYDKQSQMSMSRNVYLQEPSLETHQKGPLIERNNNYSNIKAMYVQKKQTSPFDKFKKQMAYESPTRYQLGKHQKTKSVLTSSAIKVQDVYPQNSVRIAQPRTKWKDISQNYFDHVRWDDKCSIFNIDEKLYKTTNMGNQQGNSNRKRENMKNNVKSGRKKDSQVQSVINRISLKQNEVWDENEKRNNKNRQRKKFLSVVSGKVQD